MNAAPTILHLGLGAFHRAHQAAYLQRLHDLGDSTWQIVAGNIRTAAPDTGAVLAAQGGAYTLETVAPGGQRSYQTITAIKRALPHEPGLDRIIACGAEASTAIISFTVTEAGYFLGSNDRLDLHAHELAADLAAARAGRPGTTIYGALCAILRERKLRHGAPVTLLCCDNLRHNGSRFRYAFLQFLALVDDPELVAWVRTATSAPNSMVDRITPRTPPELCARVAKASGWRDAAPVMSESFSQWVIEDDFCYGRPNWARAGVELVESVAPYEEAKIRILNATHSCIAWAGAVAGHRFIHQCMRDPHIAAIAHDYVTGAVFDCLEPSPVDLARYRDQVFERFSSDAIEDTTERVVADSFSKLPGFIVPTLRERLARGLDIGSVAMLPALFLHFLQRWNEGALALAYADQGMDLGAIHAICNASDPVAQFCSLTSLWGELANDARLCAAVRTAVGHLPEPVAS